MLAEERRQYKRFSPIDGTFVYNESTMGTVIDISQGGLSFLHIDDTVSSEETRPLNINLNSDSFYIDEIQSKVIRNGPVKKSTVFYTKTWESAVQFVSLTDNQKEQIRSFLVNFTTREA